MVNADKSREKKSRQMLSILVKKGITQTAIAIELGVKLPSVNAVILLKSRSKRIEKYLEDITNVDIQKWWNRKSLQR